MAQALAHDQAPKPKTLVAFNGLRFIAAVAVVFFHFFSRSEAYTRQHPIISHLAESGPVALGFFFILSGFVLAHATCNRLQSVAERPMLFWFARFARLYPTYLLAFVLFLPMAWVKYISLIHRPGLFVAAGLSNLSVLQAWTPLALSWNGPSWSLSTEAFFYAIFPSVVHFLLNCRAKLLAALIGLLWSAEMALTACHVAGFLPLSLWHAWFQYNPLYWTPLFVGGIGLYRLYGRWQRVPPAAAAATGAGAFFLLLLSLATCSEAMRDVLVMGGIAPLFALMILALSHNNNIVSRLLGWRPLFLGGAASYTVYILQAPIWHYFVFIAAKLSHRREVGASHAVFLLYLVCLVLISLAVQKRYDVPVHRLMMQWLARTDVEQADTAPEAHDRAA